jgi:hypothetical protein
MHINGNAVISLLNELECAWNTSKNRKVTGMDNINMELLK